MAKITVKPDCGNSPRKLFLKDWNVAYAEGDTTLLIDNAAEDIVWDFVGSETVKGKAAFEETVKARTQLAVDALVIHTIVTHGKEAAVNGDVELVNGKRYSFCDVVTFQGAKGNTIKSITSYIIATKGEK